MPRPLVAPAPVCGRSAALAVLVALLSACTPTQLAQTSPAPDTAPDTDSAPLDSAPPEDTGTPEAPTHVLLINELMSDNASTVYDDRGALSDWLELYNPGDRSVHVGGYRVGDSPDLAEAWTLPPGLLVPAGGFLLLWADGDSDPEDAHLPFKLSSGGEDVALWDPDGVLVDQVVLGPLGPDQAQARTEDGGPSWAVVDAATPGGPNNAPREVSVELLPIGAVWAYRDTGQVPPDGWTAADYDASGWSSGAAPLGYGDPVTTEVGYGTDANNKHITTWFRVVIEVEAGRAAQAESLQILLRADDGALLSLNGVELLRQNLPTGTITASTLASNTVSGSGETSYAAWSVAPGALVDGLNVLTAEVHQVVSSSSDLVFDAGMSLTYLEGGS